MKTKLLFLFLVLSTSIVAQTVGIFLNDSEAYNGYTLIAANYEQTYLIDNCGFVVNSWESDQTPGASTYLLENGNLLRTGRISSNFGGGGSGGRIELHSWEGDLLWRYDYSSPDFHQHHDVAILPNGNILLIAWELHSSNDAIDNGRDSLNTNNEGVWSEKIVELEPVGTDQANVIWEWRLWDHLVQDFDSEKLNFGDVSDHPELVDVNFNALPGSNGVDWIHFNSIHYNIELDQIIVGSRNFNEFWIIDHSTTTEEAAGHEGGTSGKGGDILYRWGNPQTYQQGSAQDQKLFGQHDVQWISTGLEDEQKVMLFNNGFNRPDGDFSTIDILEPPLESDGNYSKDDGIPYEPDELFWTYSADTPESFYSANISGVQRLPNGNTLICEGRSGFIFEINANAETVWAYQNPVRSNTGPVEQGVNINNLSLSLFRAYKYGPDYPAFDGKTLVPGEPIELNPLDVFCTIFDITSTNDPKSLEGIRLLGNPIQDLCRIENTTNGGVLIKFYDPAGRLIKQLESSDTFVEINMEHLPVGMYFLSISNLEGTHFFKEKVIKL